MKKKYSENEIKVSNNLSFLLKIQFNKKQFNLNNWGKVDRWFELSENIYLFIEIETTQPHPDTNVLKLWPFLDENKKTKVFLIQTFFLYNKKGKYSTNLKGNRGKLCEWTANKLKQLYPNQFNYFKIIFNNENDIKIERDELKKLIYEINKFKNNI